MNAQLLLLLALAGPFCAFTRASPTLIPTDPNYVVTQTEKPAAFYTSEPPKGYTVFTGPPPTEPEAVPSKMSTAAATATFPLEMTTATDASEVPREVTMEATTAAALNDTVVTSEQPTSRTQQQPPVTRTAAAETAAPTEEAEVAQTSGAAAATTDSSGDGGIQKGTGDGLTPGQAAGIVIGALLAVAAVIAVAIVVARRMGKYSP